MLIHIDPKQARPVWPASAVCIGTFDGMHLGHRELAKRTVAIAKEREWPAGMVTFDRNPLELLHPDRAPLAIRTWRRNIEIAADLGISFCLVLPFTHELSQTSAEDFVEQNLRTCCRAKTIIVGEDFALGKGRRGTAHWLSEQMETIITAPVHYEGTRVSSTQIRNFLEAGQIEEANVRLGQMFDLQGVVIGGEKLGRKLGFPTLNLARFTNTILPLEGVYAGYAKTIEGRFGAAISLGTRPTIGEGTYSVEAFLLDFTGPNLYGTYVELEFIKRIRGQEKFASIDDLKNQMTQDVQIIRQIIELS